MILATQDIAYLNSNDHYARQLYEMTSIDTFFYRTALDEDVEHNDIDFSNSSLVMENHTVRSTSTLMIHGQKIAIKTNLLER